MKNKNLSAGGHYDGLHKAVIDGGHCLIAGTTGSGKSVFINGFLYNYITILPPDNTLILIDPKRVELLPWKNTPHCIYYANTAAKAHSALEYAEQIVEWRFARMEKQGVREWQGGKCFVVIDEIIDLLTSPYGKQIKKTLTSLLSVSRAAGLFILYATQMPNRTTLSAGLVANCNTRIALRCLSAIESRQVIGIEDAVALPKYGECIVLQDGEYFKTSVPYYTDEQIKDKLSFYEGEDDKPTIKERVKNFFCKHL